MRFQLVAGRRGGGAAREACIDQLEAEARNIIVDASARTRISINAFEQLATRLATLKSPVNIVLISEGLMSAAIATI